MSPVTARLGKFAANQLPLISALLFVLLSMLPLRAPGDILMPPLFALMAIFFWSIHRPDRMGPVQVFVVGLALDIVSNGPPGLYALTFLVAYAFSVSQRILFTGRFAIGQWLGFAMTLLLVETLAWIATSFYHGRPLSPVPLFAQTIASILFYPPVARVLGTIEHRLMAPV